MSKQETQFDLFWNRIKGNLSLSEEHKETVRSAFTEAISQKSELDCPKGKNVNVYKQILALWQKDPTKMIIYSIEHGDAGMSVDYTIEPTTEAVLKECQYLTREDVYYTRRADLLDREIEDDTPQPHELVSLGYNGDGYPGGELHIFGINDPIRQFLKTQKWI